MTSLTVGYYLPTFTGLRSHGWSRAAFLRDTDDESYNVAKREIDVQVRSGDYFVTLATTLDSIGRNATGYHVRANIEDLVSDLIYLQDHYTITKNKQSE